MEIGCGSGYVISSVAMLLAQQGLRAHCLAVDISGAATRATAATLRAHGVRQVLGLYDF